MNTAKQIWKQRRIHTVNYFEQKAFTNGFIIASIVWAILITIALEVGRI